MPATLKDFQPMAADASAKKVRIEHICTGESTVEPLPYLVNAQRRSDRRGGGDTWVVVGSDTEEAFLVGDLRPKLATGRREYGEVTNSGHGKQWDVRSSRDIEDLTPGADCVVVTTAQHLLCRLVAASARGSAPKQFSNNMTFMLNMGWGNMSLGQAVAYDRLVKLIFDTKDSSDRRICTISSGRYCPFGEALVERRQDCRVLAEDEGVGVTAIQCSNEKDPDKAMYDIIEGLKGGSKNRAIMLIDYEDAETLKRVGPVLGKRCHDFSPFLQQRDVQNKKSHSARHAVLDGIELTYLGALDDLTHLLIYPYRDASVWDKVTGQIMNTPRLGRRSKAELKYATCWRGTGAAPEICYLGSGEEFDGLPEEPEHLMIHTQHFDSLVLSCLSVWPNLAVAQLPLKLMENALLTEERLRRLKHKGLLVVDESREKMPRAQGLFLCYSFLKLTARGSMASALLSPYALQMDSIHAASLLAQLLEKTSGVSPSVVNAVCSLAVVLDGIHGATYIDRVVRPNSDYKDYRDYPYSLAFDYCHRGPIWVAVCVWHYTRVNKGWLAVTATEHRSGGTVPNSIEANGCTLDLHCQETFNWEKTKITVDNVLRGLDVQVQWTARDHKLTLKELLDVEEMLVTAYMDKLAFISMPAGNGPFGYILTTGAELEKPTDEQMRLIDLDKCWEEEKKAAGQDTPGLFCVFTYHRKTCKDGREMRLPGDLTHVSMVAVGRALRKLDAPMFDGDIFSKIKMDYVLDG